MNSLGLVKKLCRDPALVATSAFCAGPGVGVIQLRCPLANVLVVASWLPVANTLSAVETASSVYVLWPIPRLALSPASTVPVYILKPGNSSALLNAVWGVKFGMWDVWCKLRGRGEREGCCAKTCLGHWKEVQSRIRSELYIVLSSPCSGGLLHNARRETWDWGGRRRCCRVATKPDAIRSGRGCSTGTSGVGEVGVRHRYNASAGKECLHAW